MGAIIFFDSEMAVFHLQSAGMLQLFANLIYLMNKS